MTGGYCNRNHAFQYMLLLRGATSASASAAFPSMFQYMLLLRGATQLKMVQPGRSECFNTCSSCEEQLHSLCLNHQGFRFQYMLLLRGATLTHVFPRTKCRFQYMLLLRGATACLCASHTKSSRFNTCSSCEEQPIEPLFCQKLHRFQYMLLLRGATDDFFVVPAEQFVSIHAPLARSNLRRVTRRPKTLRFQYMLLLRGATFCGL